MLGIAGAAQQQQQQQQQLGVSSPGMTRPPPVSLPSEGSLCSGLSSTQSLGGGSSSGGGSARSDYGAGVGLHDRPPSVAIATPTGLRDGDEGSSSQLSTPYSPRGCGGQPEQPSTPLAMIRRPLESPRGGGGGGGGPRTPRDAQTPPPPAAAPVGVSPRSSSSNPFRMKLSPHQVSAIALQQESPAVMRVEADSAADAATSAAAAAAASASPRSASGWFGLGGWFSDRSGSGGSAAESSASSSGLAGWVGAARSAAAAHTSSPRTNSSSGSGDSPPADAIQGCGSIKRFELGSTCSTVYASSTSDAGGSHGGDFSGGDLSCGSGGSSARSNYEDPPTGTGTGAPPMPAGRQLGTRHGGGGGGGGGGESLARLEELASMSPRGRAMEQTLSAYPYPPGQQQQPARGSAAAGRIGPGEAPYLGDYDDDESDEYLGDFEGPLPELQQQRRGEQGQAQGRAQGQAQGLAQGQAHVGPHGAVPPPPKGSFSWRSARRRASAAMAAMPAPSAALQPASDRINFAERGYSLAPEQAPEGWAKTAPKFSLRRPSKEAGLGVHADGSDVMVPTLQFSPRAQAEASEMSRSDFWVHGVPDVEWPPTVFWFYGETAEERATLTIQRFARAWLERRMITYLHTMRRLIMILATRERKAARLIRERWLTKAILEKNSQRLRPVLEALLASVCKDKPDRLLDYATEWMRTSYPIQAAEAAAADVICEWQPRTDVEPTQEGLMAYLEETNATTILEGIIERAIAAQPSNVTAYVVDELVALNPDVKLPEEDEDDDLGLSDTELDADDEEAILAEEEALMDEQELIAEEEELLMEEEEVELEQLEQVAELEAGELGPDFDFASPGAGGFLDHGPLATLEEDDEELEEDSSAALQKL